MIITKQKDLDDLLTSIEKGPVFIIGCSECATLCHTGGEDEVQKMLIEAKKNSAKMTSKNLDKKEISKIVKEFIGDL